MPMSSEILILMSTHNGAHYLHEQIESVLRQNYKEWRLIIRDDGSVDATREVIKEYTRKYSGKISLFSDAEGNIGVTQSMLRLLECCDAGYIMFCDQDDVWLPDKIKITLDRMKDIESTYGVDAPGLVHTNLKVSDKDLNIVSESFWKYQRLDPGKGTTLNRLLVQNTVTGCTVMINKALKDKIKFFPEGVIIYDWWLSLIAAALGRIAYVSGPTLLYRQHNGNTIGAKEWNPAYVNKMVKSGRKNLRAILLKTQLQAKTFLEVYKDELSAEDKNLAFVYSTLNRQGPLGKRLNLLKYGFFKIGFRRNVGLFLAI